MEHSSQSGHLQDRAELLLTAIIQGYTPADAARRIIELATTTHENPVKELFRANDTSSNAQTGDGRVADTSSHRHKFSLRFSRKDKVKAVCDAPLSEKPSGNYHNVFQADVKPSTSRDSEPAKQNSRREGIAPNAATQFFKGKGSSSSGHYNCVFCHTDYTTKGTCKRHIEEIHVAKRYFRCVFCRREFATAPEARKHCQSCGAGVLGWTVETPEGHKIYSSEFETHRVFSTQQAYIVHLLELSALPMDGRSVRSWHRKLRNLLEQPQCIQAVQALSVRLFNSPDAWCNVRWEHERVRKAVKELEMGILDLELNSHDLPRLHRLDDFLHDLFHDRVLNTTVSADSPVHENITEDEKTELKLEEDEKPHPIEEEPPPQQPEPTPKRPLSLESAAALPNRIPPGPPVPRPPTTQVPISLPPHMAQMSAQPSHQYQYPNGLGHVNEEQLPPNSSSGLQHIHYNSTPHMAQQYPQQHSLQVQSPQQNQPHHQQALGYWPNEQHPPPYENGYAAPLPPRQSSFSSHPQPNYIAPDTSSNYYDPNYMPLAELSMTSAITSPTIYMPSAEQTMSFYSQPQQQPGAEMPVQHIIPYSPMAFSPTHTQMDFEHRGQGTTFQPNGQGSGFGNLDDRLHSQQQQHQQPHHEYRPM
ncbi:hypothetical protein LTR62_002257 [Meristemomyces frigidus]|uniref:C2H2-type domain-containing protein n=1 Tax=Meristemomyces frigidus TaxID=1508187 RepID=A0AAN7TL31_9PEZI|nr:hypothetical protein LTR62_002257 [Meristemomyces frigidus]